jgi:hypothetical protein
MVILLPQITCGHLNVITKTESAKTFLYHRHTRTRTRDGYMSETVYLYQLVENVRYYIHFSRVEQITDMLIPGLSNDADSTEMVIQC